MRFMLIVKASRDSEAGAMPAAELLCAMGRYNDELVKAGVLLASEGLHPSSKGARVHFSRGTRNVVLGPFAATSESIAGFWLIQAKSLAEAIEWVTRCPNPYDEDTHIEIRQVVEAGDFGAGPAPGLQDQEARARSAERS